MNMLFAAVRELQLALFANLLRCNGASATEGKPAVIGVTA